MSWRDTLTPSYRPRPLHSTTSSRECVSLRSTYTPSSSISTSISNYREPTALRRRASEATVTASPSLKSYSVSSYSRYRPTGGTLIDLPTVDPYDLPRRYRSSYDRDEYKRTDYATRPDYSAPTYSRQDPNNQYRKDYSAPEYSRQDSVDRYRDRSYSTSSRREPKEETNAVDVALSRISESAEASFEMVVLKKEFTAVAKIIKEIRKVKLPPREPVDDAVLKVQEKRQKDIRRALEMREVRREDTQHAEEKQEAVSSYEGVQHSLDSRVEQMTVPVPNEREQCDGMDASVIVDAKHDVSVDASVSVEKIPEGVVVDDQTSLTSKKKVLKKRIVRVVKRSVPVLPDVVMRKVFSSLTYRELCKAEVTCTRWQKLIIDLLRRDIQEITIERLGSSQIIVVHQPPFKRLNITCPADSYDFLSGVVRRSRLAALKLTTDLHFLSNMDKLAIDLSPPRLRKYFANVDDLWLIIVSINEEDVAGIERMAEVLFSQLTNITMQCHVHVKSSSMITRCIKALTRWYGDTDMSLEIHSDTAEAVYDQLSSLADLSLYKLKLICTEFDSPELCITAIASLLAKNGIRTKILTFRDWSIRCDSSTLLTSHPMETLRISSCDVLTVDDFLKAMIATEKQDAPDPKKARIASKEDLKPSRKRKLPFIKRFEMAGQCRLRGLEFLTNKAHKELEKMLMTHFPLMEFDYSEIYYFE